MKLYVNFAVNNELRWRIKTVVNCHLMQFLILSWNKEICHVLSCCKNQAFDAKYQKIDKYY